MRAARRDDNKNALIWKILVGVLSLVIVVLVIVVLNKEPNNPNGDSENSQNTENTQGTETGKNTETEEDEKPKYDTETFVIFGLDSRDTRPEAWDRSDSIILVNVNHDLSEVRVVSIYRDTMAKIEGTGYHKLNHGYANGGPNLALDTLNTNYDLDLEKYVSFNFDSAGDIVDELGGIEMDITASEVRYINGYIDEVNAIRGTSSAHITKAGHYTLDGTQAVAYSRIRYTEGGDSKRTERQRAVLFKMFEKAKTLDTVERIEFAEEFLDEIRTNYSTDRITTLLYCMSQYNIVTMDAFPKVYYDGLVGDLWYEVPCSLIDMNRELHKVLLQEDEYEPSEEVKQISAELESKVDGPNVDKTQSAE